MGNFYYSMGSSVEVVLLLAGFLVTLFAQIMVKSNYSKYLKEKNSNGLTGFDVARRILDSEGLNNVHIVEVKGNLSDHYDPNKKVVRLSSSVFHNSSIASVSIAAHECGHAIQDKENYSFMKIRAFLVPIVNFVNKFGYIATIIGIIANTFDILICGIVMIMATLVFQLVTLPVEFDASRRAKVKIDNLNLATLEEQKCVKKMLNSAAFTYVAGVIESIFQLLRLVIIYKDRDR